jgi:hypothetical protein
MSDFRGHDLHHPHDDCDLDEADVTPDVAWWEVEPAEVESESGAVL